MNKTQFGCIYLTSVRGHSELCNFLIRAVCVPLHVYVVACVSVHAYVCLCVRLYLSIRTGASSEE